MSGTPAASRPSITADSALLSRAAHQIIEPPPHILDDPIALAFVGEEQVRGIAQDPARWHEPNEARTRMHMVVRSRFAEDTLEESVARGVRQYVILGAGFDSFAYRRPVWASDIRSSRWISRRRRRKNSNG